MKYTVKPTNRFRKEYKLAMKRGLNIRLLDAVITKLANGVPLEPANRDQELTGDYAGHRECHVAPDWLLVYYIDEDVLVLSLVRTGSHSDLF
ncbi:MAG: type II toxin-antitoxin system YafQ family toxin [Propionibacteriaceae bacterium]|jgi:mRNA interferase YafQ|nr:type II toxin-antitoxin system YafQ family toxin [Propionibacteriaceae bacterium]